MAGWATTRDLLVKHGLQQHWDSPHICVWKSKVAWKELIYEAVEAAEGADMRRRLGCMRGAAAARYDRIKGWGPVSKEFAVFSGEVDRRGALVPEPYLDDRTEPVGRRLKLMCRLGCLPTMERVAREEKLQPTQARCRLCDDGEREDMQHLILSCPAHNRHRSKMIAAVSAAVTQPIGCAFSELDSDSQIDYLLGKSTGIARIDDQINGYFTRFLKKAWRGRSWLTTAVNEKLGRADTVWALKCHGDGERRAAAAARPHRRPGRRAACSA